jgi:hypothetical protein
MNQSKNQNSSGLNKLKKSIGLNPRRKSFLRMIMDFTVGLREEP